jgi:hypothetical protein
MKSMVILEAFMLNIRVREAKEPPERFSTTFILEPLLKNWAIAG